MLCAPFLQFVPYRRFCIFGICAYNQSYTSCVSENKESWVLNTRPNIKKWSHTQGSKLFFLKQSILRDKCASVYAGYFGNFCKSKLPCTESTWIILMILISMYRDYIDGLVHDCGISIANAPGILQSRTKPSNRILTFTQECVGAHTISIHTGVTGVTSSSTCRTRGSAFCEKCNHHDKNLYKYPWLQQRLLGQQHTFTVLICFIDCFHYSVLSY